MVPTPAADVRAAPIPDEEAAVEDRGAAPGRDTPTVRDAAVVVVVVRAVVEVEEATGFLAPADAVPPTVEARGPAVVPVAGRCAPVALPATEGRGAVRAAGIVVVVGTAVVGFLTLAAVVAAGPAAAVRLTPVAVDVTGVDRLAALGRAATPTRAAPAPTEGDDVVLAVGRTPARAPTPGRAGEAETPTAGFLTVAVPGVVVPSLGDLIPGVVGLVDVLAGDTGADGEEAAEASSTCLTEGAASALSSIASPASPADSGSGSTCWSAVASG